MFFNLKNCNNTEDFRQLAKNRLPGPIFHYIDGAADDEVTIKRNTEAYEQCDLVPNVLAGVENIDMSVEVMGKSVAATSSRNSWLARGPELITPPPV